MNKTEVLNYLNNLGISYTYKEHPPVYTIEDMAKLGLNQQGEIAKNLFLRDAKGKRHFLIVLRHDKRVNFKALSVSLKTTALSFASAARLSKYLSLPKGSVTPLGILNDLNHEVEVIIDQDLKGLHKIGVHPNDNTATVWLSPADLEAIINREGNKIQYIALNNPDTDREE